MEIELSIIEDVTNAYENHVDRLFVDCSKGAIVVHEAEKGTMIRVFTMSGKLIGSSKAFGNVATIKTDLKKGEFAIVHIGEKSLNPNRSLEILPYIMFR